MELNDHQYIRSQDIVEKYILAKLPPETEEAFEEHLLFCAECREEIRQKRLFILAAQQTLENKVFNPKKINGLKLLLTPIGIRVAAGILLLLAMGIALYYVSGRKTKENLEANEQIKKGTSTVSDTSANGSQGNKYIITENDPANVTADNYKPFPALENDINNQMRGGEIKVISPVVNKVFSPDQSVLFQWEVTETSVLSLLIRDNKGNILLDSAVSSPFQYKAGLLPGLYYWQLATEDESLFTGKFLIK